MKTTSSLTTSSHAHQEARTPTTMLREEHVVILRGLALLERVGERLELRETVDRNALRWLIDFFRTLADRCHHGKEEEHLFPALERYGIPKDSGPLAVLREEHEEGRALVRAIAEGEDRQAAEAIRRYVTLLRAHIDKENTILFPLADQVLPDDEQRMLIYTFEEVEQAVAGPGVHEQLLTGLARLEEGDR